MAVFTEYVTDGNTVVGWSPFLHHIAEVPASNLFPENSCPDWRFCGFHQSIQADAETVPQSRQLLLCSTSSTID
jgi:hypothetical protein